MGQLSSLLLSGSPLDAPFAERLYSVFIGWLCFGAFLDWKKEHPSAQLLTRRSTRLIVFGALTVVSSYSAGFPRSPFALGSEYGAAIYLGHSPEDELPCPVWVTLCVLFLCGY